MWKRIRSIVRDDTGVSGVELAVSIVVLGIVLAAAAPAMLAASQITVDARIGAQAERDAYSTAEDVAYANTARCTASTKTAAFTPTPAMRGVEYQRRTVVTCTTATVGVGQVEVKITRTDSGEVIANVVTRFMKES